MAVLRMDAGLATQRAVRSLLYRQLSAACATAGTLALLLLGSMLLARRLAGALTRPLEALSLLLAAIVLTVVCQGLHALWRRVELSRRACRAAALGVSAAFVAIALALSLPGSPRVPLAALWALVVIGEGLAQLVAWRGWPARQGSRPRSARSVASPGLMTDSSGTIRPVSQELPEAAETGLPPGATQRLTRTCEPSGGEMIHGSLRETFAPGQRTASLHVAFCPPLAVLPELAVEQLDGPETAVKVGELQPYGARLDLRLKRASSQPVDVLLELSVVAASIEA